MHEQQLKNSRLRDADQLKREHLEGKRITELKSLNLFSASCSLLSVHREKN